ncbi:hypothetical protein TEA_013269 [Camellia sinensis var. sinensis]|uniref:Uncharacterized protein n=1 Tax=Camellia sinensis var. sinensis TaxID=542762 RepID=A0A4S4D5S5_CAMSN|nr:hypothetical protein TEA_013269 [Camellia sinensis var. sinensis]
MGKRRRPRKRKVEEEEEEEEEGQAESGFNGVRHEQVPNNPTPSPPPVSNTPVSSSRSPTQHVKTENGSQKHWHLWMANRGETIENVNNSAKSEDWSIPKQNDLVDIEKLTSKLLHQSQGPEKHHPADPPSAPYELVLDNHLPNMEATEAPNIIENRHEERANNLDQKAEPTQSLSLNITEMAAMSDDFSDLDEVASALNVALVTVNGYRVKEEFASLLRDIFSKYGDIAKDSSLQSERSRSSFLEMVCGIFQRLQGTKFTDVTDIELKSMLDIIGDIEFVKLEVGWLRTRLQEIYEAKLLFMGSSSLKEAKTRNSEAIGKMEQVVEGYQIEIQILQEKISSSEDKLAAMKAESEKINGMVLNTKTKVKCFHQRSLWESFMLRRLEMVDAYVTETAPNLQRNVISTDDMCRLQLLVQGVDFDIYCLLSHGLRVMMFLYSSGL